MIPRSCGMSWAVVAVLNFPYLFGKNHLCLSAGNYSGPHDCLCGRADRGLLLFHAYVGRSLDRIYFCWLWAVCSISVALASDSSCDLASKCIWSRVNDLSWWFFAAAMSNLRPQNLPLSAIYRKFYYFTWKVLVFSSFKPKWYFKVTKFRKSASSLSLLSQNSIKASSLFKTAILEAAQSIFTISHYNTLKSSFVYFQFQLHNKWRCYLYRLLLLHVFSICFRCRCSLIFTLVLDS